MVAQVIVKNLAGPTGLLGNREPHVGSDLHVALKALAGFVVHGDIITLKLNRSQHLTTRAKYFHTVNGRHIFA